MQRTQEFHELVAAAFLSSRQTEDCGSELLVGHDQFSEIARGIVRSVFRSALARGALFLMLALIS